MEKLGTKYGGWYVPEEMELNEDSIIYSAGVGEDISFDLLLNNKYKSHIYCVLFRNKLEYNSSREMCVIFYSTPNLK